MVVPLNSKERSVGVYGVDMVREHQNLVRWVINGLSLWVILSVFIMELRRSESEAQLEKAYLQNIYRIFLLVSSCMIRMGL